MLIDVIFYKMSTDGECCEMKNDILECNLSDKQYAALANKTRRMILLVIYNQLMSPRTIAEKTGYTMALVKRHLKILLACELVVQKKQGNGRLYMSNRQFLSQFERKT